MSARIATIVVDFPTKMMYDGTVLNNREGGRMNKSEKQTVREALEIVDCNKAILINNHKANAKIGKATMASMIEEMNVVMSKLEGLVR
jgi:hypothetical protein